MMLAAEIERRYGRLTVRIDRTLCVGFGDCVTAAPEVFELDADGIAVFIATTADEALLLEACRQCPVDALTVLDQDGKQMVP